MPQWGRTTCERSKNSKVTLAFPRRVKTASCHLWCFLPCSGDVYKVEVPGAGCSESTRSPVVGPPVVPFFSPFLGEGSHTKIDYRKKGTLVLTSLLEDLVLFPPGFASSGLGVEKPAEKVPRGRLGLRAAEPPGLRDGGAEAEPRLGRSRGKAMASKVLVARAREEIVGCELGASPPQEKQQQGPPSKMHTQTRVF